MLCKDGSVWIFEAKYLQRAVGQSIIDEELAQIKRIRELNVAIVGFISINGFCEGVGGLDYLFDGDDLYE